MCACIRVVGSGSDSRLNRNHKRKKNRKDREGTKHNEVPNLGRREEGGPQRKKKKAVKQKKMESPGGRQPSVLLPGDRAASEGGEERMERTQKRRERGPLSNCACVTQSRDAPRGYRCISSSRSTRKQQNTTRRCSSSLTPASPRGPLPTRLTSIKGRVKGEFSRSRARGAQLHAAGFTKAVQRSEGRRHRARWERKKKK